MLQVDRAVVKELTIITDDQAVLKFPDDRALVGKRAADESVGAGDLFEDGAGGNGPVANENTAAESRSAAEDCVVAGVAPGVENKAG